MKETIYNIIILTLLVTCMIVTSITVMKHNNLVKEYNELKVNYYNLLDEHWNESFNKIKEVNRKWQNQQDN